MQRSCYLYRNFPFELILRQNCSNVNLELLTSSIVSQTKRRYFKNNEIYYSVKILIPNLEEKYFNNEYNSSLIL